mmetsp:Transcript_108788/g.281196  ORF Transcript_108788/g.281196 Transcript_108788/m.281196 type:complete len:106 (+) Transcript_108788:579-896(+)
MGSKFRLKLTAKMGALSPGHQARWQSQSRQQQLSTDLVKVSHSLEGGQTCQLGRAVGCRRGRAFVKPQGLPAERCRCPPLHVMLCTLSRLRLGHPLAQSGQRKLL